MSELRKYEVGVDRFSSRMAAIVVEATSEEEAENKAMDMVGDFDFTKCSESDPEHSIAYVTVLQ